MHSKNLALINYQQACELIGTLAALGITYFGVSPGSRSTPLALAIASLDGIESHVHFDERGLGFWAVGLAKSIEAPVAIVTTSGTAVANLFPAVMEAFHSRLPLIIITADRPPEMIGKGANQTTFQDQFFHRFCQKSVTLPCPAIDTVSGSLRPALIDIVTEANRHQRPVHVNVPYREPLCPPAETLTPFLIPPSIPTKSMSRPPVSLPKDLLEAGKTVATGLILVGKRSIHSNPKDILALSEALNWPIIADINSQLRLTAHPHMLHYGNILMESDPESVKPEMVIQIGHPLISKSAFSTLKRCPIWLNIQEYEEIQDPFETVTHCIFGRLSQAKDSILSTIPKSSGHFLSDLQKKHQYVTESLNKKFQSAPFSEKTIAAELIPLIPKDWGLFISNSLPVRVMNDYASPTPYHIPIESNRGVSGIDGIVSSAIGFFQGLRKAGIALIGDLSFFHDLNGLAQLKSLSTPLILIVINNHGGGIFNTLPVAIHQDHFEKFFKTPQNVKIADIARSFGVDYKKISTQKDFRLFSLKNSHSHLIIEVELQP